MLGGEPPAHACPNRTLLYVLIVFNSVLTVGQMTKPRVLKNPSSQSKINYRVVVLSTDATYKENKHTKSPLVVICIHFLITICQTAL